MGRFSPGDDLLSSLAGFCRAHRIKLGFFSVIGAVRKARVGYYHQRKKKYVACAEFKKKLEIVSCSGNISLKENAPAVHAHIVFADYSGKTYGGHLMEGTAVFAAEFVIQEYTGARLARKPDALTGLPLW